MKKFKDYAKKIDADKQARIDRDLLSWPSSNGEMRDKLPQSNAPEPMLSWDSSFAGMRDAVAKLDAKGKIQEALDTKAPIGSKAHFLHHAVGFQAAAKKRRELRNEYGYNVTDMYSQHSYGVDPKKFKKAQKEYRKHDTNYDYHNNALLKHHPDFHEKIDNIFGAWAGSDHSPAEAKAIAAAHYHGITTKKKVADIPGHTSAHIKAVIGAYHTHTKAAEKEVKNYSNLGYALTDIHSEYKTYHEKSLASTYGHGNAQKLMDAHANGTLHAASKEVAKAYSGKTEPSLGKSTEPANFLGAGKVRPSQKTKKTHEHWDREVEKHSKIPKVRNLHGVYHHAIHTHPEVGPTVVRDNDRQAIDRYTGSYSATINGYLRYRAGDRSYGQHPGNGERVHKDTEEKIKNLSNVFSKGNTNRIPMHTWSGVPAHVGTDLMNSSIGSYHHIAGFTSTSTHKSTANSFAVGHAGSGDSDRHIIHYKVQKGAGLSVAAHSAYDENEVILHHGAQIKYRGTTVYHPKDDSTLSHKVHVHHVTVYPKSLPLSKYGPIGDEYK